MATNPEPVRLMGKLMDATQTPLAFYEVQSNVDDVFTAQFTTDEFGEFTYVGIDVEGSNSNYIITAPDGTVYTTGNFPMGGPLLSTTMLVITINPDGTIEFSALPKEGRYTLLWECYRLNWWITGRVFRGDLEQELQSSSIFARFLHRRERRF